MLLYQPHRDPENPRVFFFYEQYTDKAAYEVRGASPHFQKHGFGDAIPRLGGREREWSRPKARGISVGRSFAS